ncbi:MAG: hypothetical protein JNN01_02160 [Opitutaceae bacterium]|nr:hypothetical protein [Opitutaceae bacterium]
MKLRLLVLSLSALSLGITSTSPVSAQSAADIRGFAPVSISSANYANTSRDALVQAVEGQNVVNPPPLSLKALSEPVHFVFIPGEVFESDLSYEDVCELLTASLKEKGYINGADKFGIIREQAKVKLVLRVNFGMRSWRLPKVRTESLTWYDGLVPRPRGRTLTTLGGEVAFENRSGGEDTALSSVAANMNNTSSLFGRGASSANQTVAAPVDPVGATGVAYGNTRDFNLIVIDAFDYQELKAKGKSARRQWTTFVASPVEPGKKFSDVAVTLVRSATPHWGETTQGMQVINDARADVKIGEAVVVPDGK